MVSKCAFHSRWRSRDSDADGGRGLICGVMFYARVPFGSISFVDFQSEMYAGIIKILYQTREIFKGFIIVAGWGSG